MRREAARFAEMARGHFSLAVFDLFPFSHRLHCQPAEFSTMTAVYARRTRRRRERGWGGWTRKTAWRTAADRSGNATTTRLLRPHRRRAPNSSLGERKTMKTFAKAAGLLALTATVSS